MRALLLGTLAASALAACAYSDSEICDPKTGYTLCGYCRDDRIATGNPHGGQCRYCEGAGPCNGDVCGELTCGPTGGGGGTCQTCACPQYSTCDTCGGTWCKSNLCSPGAWCCPGTCNLGACGCN